MANNLNMKGLLEALNNIEISPTASFFSSGYNYVFNLGVTAAQSSQVLYTNLYALGIQLDTDILYANDNGSSSVPLTISSAASPANGVVRITFTTDPSAYFSTSTQNRYIYLTGFGNGSSSSTVINGPREISAIDVVSNSIDFQVAGVTSSETFSVAGGGAGTTFINSYQFRQITDTTFPLGNPGTALLIQDNPPSDQELVSLQNYIQTVTTYLKSLPTVVISALNVTTYLDPLALSTSIPLSEI